MVEYRVHKAEWFDQDTWVKYHHQRYNQVCRIIMTGTITGGGMFWEQSIRIVMQDHKEGTD